MAQAAKPKPSSLAEAVLAVQAELPTLPKDARNPHFKSRYTPLDTIVERVGPIMAKYGLTWQTFPTIADGQPALRYLLTHAPSGSMDQDTMPLLLSKNTPQELGSAITYARRYALCAVLNIVADEDDDGEATRQAALAKSEKKPTPDPAPKASAPEKAPQAPETKPESDAPVEPTGEKGAIKIIEIMGQSGKSLEDVKAWLVSRKVDTDPLDGEATLDDLATFLGELPKPLGSGLYIYLNNAKKKRDREAAEAEA